MCLRICSIKEATQTTNLSKDSDMQTTEIPAQGCTPVDDVELGASEP